jgi:chromosome segregation protein
VFLKSLTLKGFKSFAETSNLEFEPGVTVVVGPNGSGKSNIVDAVAWVLGAQGPRTLRSAKMEDVIFAGTSRRAALGRAEVSLIIDNSAGLLPIDFSEVRVTRVLWRSGESEYSINGAPCRLLDVQELLSDTGVGRQQHTIISQSQLDAILSARPEDRRAVIEEAAGVSKHRRRKEKAERRLESTEGALLRAQDLLKEVRRQLRPLERQAEAARRHGDVMGELVALRRYLHGRELGVLVSRLAAAASGRGEQDRAEAAALATLSHLDASVVAAEAALDAGRKDSDLADLAELVSSAEGLRARASGLVALLNERARSVEHDRAATVDQDVVASLEAESASLAEQLSSTEREAAALLPFEAEVDDAEEVLAQAAADLAEAYGPGPASSGAQMAWAGPGPSAANGAAVAPAKRAGEVAAELDALRRAGERLETELRHLDTRSESVAGRQARLSAEATEARQRQDECEGRAAAVAEGAEGAVASLAEAESALAAAEEARRGADADRHRWSARAEALSQALDEARARAGARRLAGVEGMLGALLELVEVEEGWEAAFEAAAGDALSAVVMDGEGAARQGLARLAGQKTPGAVIALSARPGPGPLPAPAAVVALPVGATWLRAKARSQHPAVDDLLDDLLALAAAVEGDWSAAVDLAIARPDLVVVTRGGDRCARGIWRTGTSGAGVTGAALDEARRALGSATNAAGAALGEERRAKAQAEQARANASEARRAAGENAAALRSASDAGQRAGHDLAEAVAEAEILSRRRQELLQRRDVDARRWAELEALLPELEAAADEDNRRAAEERTARHRLSERATAVATLRRDLEVRATGIEERRAMLTRRLAEVERRLEGNRAERERAAERRAHLDGTALAVARLTSFVQSRLSGLESAVEMLRERRRAEAESLRAASEGLEALRRQRAAAERQLAAVRELISRADVERAQLQGRLEALTETVRRELDCEPGALEGAECPELPPGTSAPSRARELERELRLMGPVNPLALEEFAALEERHTFLEGQLHDVTQARRELSKVIRAVDAEIITVFKAAYDDVADNFTQLVSTLFPGGHGSLYLTDPSNLLESGVELEVRPVGKNIKRLSLLSGGERSLVALAFLFAVFRSRPSPFYMMDEVESALDDVNLHRFLDLVHEFRDEAQLLIVSHQKRTMEAADCLYGVSMPPGGSSLVVSQRIDRDTDQRSRPERPTPAVASSPASSATTSAP